MDDFMSVLYPPSNDLKNTSFGSYTSGKHASIHTRRDTCRSCGGKLEVVLDLGNVVITNFGEKPLAYAPLDLGKCASCHLIQLFDTVDPEYLFREYYYKSGVNDSMRAHLKEIVGSALKRVPLARQAGGIAIDIGANDGTMIEAIPENMMRVAFEPSQLADEIKASRQTLVVRDFFSANAYAKIGSPWRDDDTMKSFHADVVFAVSMFYDLEDPNKFLEDVKTVLADDGLLVIQQNYLPAMLQQNAFDNIVHEHLEYYSVTTLSSLLSRHGLRIEEVEFNDTNGGSFRTYIRKETAAHDSLTPGSVADALAREAEMHLDQAYVYKDYAAKVHLITKKIRNFVHAETAKGKTFYIAGASTRGNTLLQVCGLEEGSVQYAVERNPAKFGKTWNGKIDVISEKAANELPPDYYLVLPWHFLNSFFGREQTFMRQGGKLLIPLPKPAIVGIEEL